MVDVGKTLVHIEGVEGELWEKEFVGMFCCDDMFEYMLDSQEQFDKWQKHNAERGTVFVGDGEHIPFWRIKRIVHVKTEKHEIEAK
jgi:hypothetical protein